MSALEMKERVIGIVYIGEIRLICLVVYSSQKWWFGDWKYRVQRSVIASYYKFSL